MSILKSEYDQVCTCCGRKFPATYIFDTNTKQAFIEYKDPCDCEADFSPVGHSPSISEWVERVKKLRPFKVEYTVTYRNIALVYAESREQAYEDALEIYGNGYFDPEDNGYDGCDVDVTLATPEQEEALKYCAYDWAEICRDGYGRMMVD